MPDSGETVTSKVAQPPIHLRSVDAREISQTSGTISASSVVRGVQLAAASNVRIPAGDALCEPRLELVRDGGAVVAIDVTCECGRKVRILCDYE